MKKKYRYTKTQEEANKWWKSAMDAGYKRGAEVGATEGEKTLHMNSFMCGVEWVLKHRPIPRAYRNIKTENN